MAVKKILLLGDEFLYQKTFDVIPGELHDIKNVITDLHDTLIDFRNRYGVGRAIAAPQIGAAKRLIYMNIGKPMVFMNPVYEYQSDEMFDLWDDCMSFPNLLVKVSRHKNISISYYNENFEPCSLNLTDSLSELLQHEMDHLDGILAVMRAKDKYSFKYKA
jgi:peptide deformylase